MCDQKDFHNGNENVIKQTFCDDTHTNLVPSAPGG